ncbi:hypothetical protein AAF712_009313 [Marasmius tenuissimus]|uniref:Uncharacterized protein n=1 Tax=Marasmius tenuissimus TaxID=585030 RepID=A0ABR2ZQ01_9AGAR
MAPQQYAPLARKTRSPLAIQAVKDVRQSTRVPRFAVNPPIRRQARPKTPDYVPHARRENNQAERESPLDRRWHQFPAEYREILDPVYDGQDEDETSGEPLEPYLFHWEDEKTLVSDMIHDGTTEQSEDSKLSTLTESIQDSLSIHSKELIDDIADTLVPAVKRVKQAHGVLNEEDVNFAEGLREYDQGCRQMEDITSLENDQVLHPTTIRMMFPPLNQTRIKELFKRLHEAYMRREQLWSDLQTALDETINPSLESLKTLPADLERTIANLEKQSKQMAQKDNGGTEKALKSLLSKFI